MVIFNKKFLRDAHHTGFMPRSDALFEIEWRMRHGDSEGALAVAYRHIMGKNPRSVGRSFNAFRWTAMACGLDDLRFYVSFVYSNGDGLLYGTDGHRLHIGIDNEGRPAGLYCPFTGHLVYDNDEVDVPLYTYQSVDLVSKDSLRDSHKVVFADDGEVLKKGVDVGVNRDLIRFGDFLVDKLYFEQAYTQEAKEGSIIWIPKQSDHSHAHNVMVIEYTDGHRAIIMSVRA